MRVLFVHQNFPGQFRHVAEALAKRPGVEVAAIGDRLCLTRDLRPQVEGLRLVTYPFEDGAAKATHPFARGYERAVRRGEQAAKAALELKSAGFTPDLIYVHPGWGEALYLREVFPEARQLHFLEFYYHPSGVDVGFDPEYPSGLEEAFRIRSRNATQLQSLDLADWFVAPTRWQASLYPPAFRQRTSVIFDGIDTERVRPRPDAQATLKDGGVTMKAGDEIITFVARQLEPYRGFHVFMRALPEILAARPHARALIVGGSGVSYGRALPKGESYRTRLLAEVGDHLPLDRVHFLGQIPYERYLLLLQLSKVHVYLTYPFVLSWSLLEAMATGAAVVASNTPPVAEVVAPKETGLLVDFFDREALARTVIGVLSGEIATDRLCRNARRLMVERYDLQRRCLPQQLALVRTLVEGGTPGVEAAP